jgi:hypothetical protein
LLLRGFPNYFFVSVVLFDSVVVVVAPLAPGDVVVPVVLELLLDVEPPLLEEASEPPDALGAGAGVGAVVVVVVEDVDVLGAGTGTGVTVVVFVSRVRSVHAPSVAAENVATSATTNARLLDCSIVAPPSIGRVYRCERALSKRAGAGRLLCHLATAVPVCTPAYAAECPDQAIEPETMAAAAVRGRGIAVNSSAKCQSLRAGESATKRLLDGMLAT